MSNDPKILAISFIGGIIPSLLWLWFWIKEEQKKPEPKAILTITFITGMVAVIFALAIEKFIQTNIDSSSLQLILWATTEEIMKYVAVMIVLYRTSYVDKPIDWPIYMITSALGFAALENALFLQKSLSLDQTTIGLFAATSLGQLRFLGSTLLHTVSSGILGISIGISMHMKGFKKKWYIFIGLVLATALHSIFNFFIMKVNGNEFLKILQVFAFLWVVTIIVMLLFEKVRRMD